MKNAVFGRLNLGIVAFVLCLTAALGSARTGSESPTFYFGGRAFHVGMSQDVAARAFDECCVLSPPLSAGIERQPAVHGRLLGHLILLKGEKNQESVGTVTFSGNVIVGMTRTLGGDEINPSSEDVVAFAKALRRALPDSETTATVSVRHEHASNGNSDVVLISFPDGRGVAMTLVTLDRPFEGTTKRDSVTLDETLGFARR